MGRSGEMSCIGKLGEPYRAPGTVNPTFNRQGNFDEQQQQSQELHPSCLRRRLDAGRGAGVCSSSRANGGRGRSSGGCLGLQNRHDESRCEEVSAARRSAGLRKLPTLSRRGEERARRLPALSGQAGDGDGMVQRLGEEGRVAPLAGTGQKSDGIALLAYALRIALACGCCWPTPCSATSRPCPGRQRRLGRLDGASASPADTSPACRCLPQRRGVARRLRPTSARRMRSSGSCRPLPAEVLADHRVLSAARICSGAVRLQWSRPVDLYSEKCVFRRIVTGRFGIVTARPRAARAAAHR